LPIAALVRPGQIAFRPTAGLDADREGLALLRSIAGRSPDFGLNLRPKPAEDIGSAAQALTMKMADKQIGADFMQ
jgi:hypothetical protein